MSAPQQRDSSRVGWHFWVIGGVALAWNALGALDYVMTQTRNESYMSAFPPEQLEFFYGLPAWSVAAWAIGVWGGLLGALLLLLRRRAAVWAFLVSLIAIAVTVFRNYVLSNGLEVLGDAFSLTLTAAVVVIAAALLLYARRLQTRGMLV